MKRTNIIILLFSLGTISLAQKPQQVLPLNMELQTIEWYEEQSDLWSAMTKEDNSKPKHWLNYYMAERNAFDLKNPDADCNHQMRKAITFMVDMMKTKFENSFEYHFMKWYDNCKSGSVAHLSLAYELDPTRTETYTHLVNQSELIGNKVEKEKYMAQLAESGIIKRDLFLWNYNMLMSLEDNAILVTQEDNDTYPAWILQSVKDVRRDVKILSIKQLLNDSYRKMKFAELHVPEESFTTDFDNDLQKKTAIFTAMISNTDNRPVYMASTVEKAVFEQFKGNLFLEGLAFRHTASRYDNLTVLKRNVEKRFLLDHLKVDFGDKQTSGIMAKMNLNYLWPFLKLYTHYDKDEETVKAFNMKKMAVKIAREGDREDEIQEYFNNSLESDQNIAEKAPFDMKRFNAEMVAVPGKKDLYASIFETTNEYYNLFLEDLLRKKEFDKITVAKTYPINWKNEIPEYFKNNPKVDSAITIRKSPSHDRHPVKGISYEGAVLFCEWMTEVYNNDKKKKFQKVKFRLPSEEEWETAALGGLSYKYKFWWNNRWNEGFGKATGKKLERQKEYAKHHQENQSAYNSLGCYLGNFLVERPLEMRVPSKYNTCPIWDGGIFTVFESSYWPNEAGLYNVHGNIAEMTNTKGIAKGGSWNHKPEESGIKDVNSYSGPDSAIGFRLFMDVIEY